MALFTTVVLHEQKGPDPAMRQRVSVAMGQIGFKRSIKGAKGPVLLPENMYAQLSDSAVKDDKVSSTERQLLADQVSHCLDRLGFKGSFFISVCTQCSWGFRPVPRKGKASEATNDSDLLELN